MDIKLAVASIAILGGLASLAYAQRPSAICPVHGVSGVLEPELVVSVGDLIQGDTVEIEKLSEFS